ncbi:hypothetical protein JW948_17475 [bacterium]|nr:hypothetical protein [bacterium]
MQEWWDSLIAAQKFFWGLAVFSTVLFLLQALMTILGLGDHGSDSDSDADTGDGTDGHADSDHAGEHSHENPFVGYFTVRNMIAFFMGFSWTGLGCLDRGMPLWLVIVCSVLVGMLFVAVVMSIMIGLSRLKSSGNISLAQAVGKGATVSIIIPAGMQGQGKVRITFQGRLMELEAVTEGPELRRGQQVRVVRLSDDLLVVEKIKQ